MFYALPQESTETAYIDLGVSGRLRSRLGHPRVEDLSTLLVIFADRRPLVQRTSAPAIGFGTTNPSPRSGAVIRLTW